MPASAGSYEVYFLLSHVRAAAPNEWVRRFHRSLLSRVESRARPTPGLRAESIYYETRAQALEALRAGRLQALRARVIVPLYTREFLFDPPPEFAPFLDGHADRPARLHIHPVLWDANPGNRGAPGLAQARSLGAGVPDYVDCGLLAMCRLNAFEDGYTTILDRLADRIVTAAQDPDHPPAWAAADSKTNAGERTETPFIISIIAAEGAAWRPFGAGALTVAEFTVAVANRWRLPWEVVQFDQKSAAEVRRAPGVLFIDPFAVDSEPHRAALGQALQQPLPWVSPVVVAEAGDDEHEARVRAVVERVNALAGRSLTLIRDPGDFARAVEDIVRHARRSYLRRNADT
jgi:hypothetical protein